MEQWSGPQHGPYLEQNQSMLNAGGQSTGLGPHPAVTHDADILQAAQLLLPGSFRDTQPPRKLYLPWYSDIQMVNPLSSPTIAVFSGRT